ncbi:MAG: SH3 domain-containing protein [Treponema sp.]|nr:SH3 domain-containing protein [Treponema sp.]
MNMYIDEISEKNLFQTLIRTTSEACVQIENWIKGESDDLSKVIKPKHGNSSTQVEVGKMNVSNVSINKTMTVKENLKLRSGEATTTQVLTVMAAGTKVKILETGKKETIDGITSNWVKVEVQSNAKGRDGKLIKAGTVGWCYGGYLEEFKSVDNTDLKKEEKISDNNQLEQDDEPVGKQSSSLVRPVCQKELQNYICCGKDRIIAYNIYRW